MHYPKATFCRKLERDFDIDDYMQRKVGKNTHFPLHIIENGLNLGELYFLA